MQHKRRIREGPDALRSRTGCLQCKRQKVKCDEERPNCTRCKRTRKNCQWPTTVSSSPSFIPPSKAARLSADQSSPKSSQLADKFNLALQPSNFTQQPYDGHVDAISPSIAFELAISNPYDYYRHQYDHEEVADKDNSQISWGSDRFRDNISIDPSFLDLIKFDNDYLIPQSIFVEHVPISNGMTLSTFDRRALDFYTRSYIPTFETKSIRWSMFYYMMSKLAYKYAPVMHMIIALAGTVVKRLEGITDTRELAVHYKAALDGISAYLTTENLADFKHPETREMVTATLWLMLLHDIRFSDGKSKFEKNANGLRLLCTYPSERTRRLSEGDAASLRKGDGNSSSALAKESNGQESTGKLVVPKKVWQGLFPRLFLWTAYLDVQGKITDSSESNFFKALYENGVLNELYAQSRSVSERIWGAEYPQDMLLDDIENTPALTLLHDTLIIRFRIEQMGRDMRAGKLSEEDLERTVGDISEDLWDIPEVWDWTIIIY